MAAMLLVLVAACSRAPEPPSYSPEFQRNFRISFSRSFQKNCVAKSPYGKADKQFCACASSGMLAKFSVSELNSMANTPGAMANAVHDIAIECRKQVTNRAVTR